MYIADGAGDGSWRTVPHAGFYYDGIGTGTTITTPTAYTLINPTTIGNADIDQFTHNGAGVLTYTGSANITCNVASIITLKHSSASLVDTFFQVFKAGVAVVGTQEATASLSGNYTHAAIIQHVSLVTNDTLDVRTKSASGNVIIHAYNMNVMGVVY